MTRIQLTWSTVWHHLEVGRALNIYDSTGTAWLRTLGHGSAWRDGLQRYTTDGIEYWTPEDDQAVWIDPPAVPEPPDGTRIEFEHNTDVYAAWRDDADSARAGYRNDEGWCLHGTTVARSWAVMWLEFGESLRTAVRLVAVPEDVPNYEKWPTAQIAAREAAKP